MKRVYVVTLFSGENELQECIDSVGEQVGVEIRHEVIRNLPNREAHQELYRRFNEARSSFDYLAKLDADMKFSAPDALLKTISLFDSGTDVVSVTVWDRITNSDMQSFNVFSAACEFDYLNNDPLFTDKVPTTYPGRHLSIVDRGRNVHHAFNPSPYQAFCFGVHRALKIMQRDADVPRLGNSYYQWMFIRSAYVNYAKTGDDAAKYAVLGAGAVLGGEIEGARMLKKGEYEGAFCKACDGDVWPRFSWLSKLPCIVALAPILGPRRFLFSVIAQFRAHIGKFFPAS